jgi:hypothetical protein
MAEQSTDDIVIINGLPLPTRKTRRNIVISTLVFCGIVIMFVVGWGDGNNSLHTSALAWSYTLMAAVIFAYVFGAVVDNFNVLKSTVQK